MLYLFLSILAVVSGTLYGLHMWITHLHVQYHNVELDQLLQRMDAWDHEVKLVRTAAESINSDLGKLKNLVAVQKR